MRLVDLLEDVERLDLSRPGEPRRATKETVRKVQAWIAEAVRDEHFCVDCIAMEVDSLAHDLDSSLIVPFARTPSWSARFGLVCWWPGLVAGPHEHTDWTVTCVFHNALEVQTYDYDVALHERRLVEKNLFFAERGKAGHIFDPCIHSPMNRTPRWSVSLHVFGANDVPSIHARGAPIAGLGLGGDAAAAPAPASAEARCQTLYRVYADLLAGYASTQSDDVLATLHDRGDPRTRARVEAARARKEARRRGDDEGLASLSLATPLRVQSTGLSVERGPEMASLIVEDGLARRTVARVDAWAEDALRFIASTPSFEPAQLPCALAPEERLALCAALVECGVLTEAA